MGLISRSISGWGNWWTWTMISKAVFLFSISVFKIYGVRLQEILWLGNRQQVLTLVNGFYSDAIYEKWSLRWNNYGGEYKGIMGLQWRLRTLCGYMFRILASSWRLMLETYVRNSSRQCFQEEITYLCFWNILLWFICNPSDWEIDPLSSRVLMNDMLAWTQV